MKNFQITILLSYIISSINAFVIYPSRYNIATGIINYPSNLLVDLKSTQTDEDFEENHEEEIPSKPIENIEKAWRYIKKPLLSIGAKGASQTHGNSLRQLLESHTAVKVKVNTPKFESSVQEIFEQLRDYAISSGAPDGIELLQTRISERTILFGLPGTRDSIANGDFPPPPPAPWVYKNDE